MSYKHRMSYVLRGGPPKPKDDLAKDEGLTDHLVVMSILGEVGNGQPLSVVTWEVSPKNKAVDPSVATKATLGTLLLAAAAEGGHPVAQAAMRVIRIVSVAGAFRVDGAPADIDAWLRQHPQVSDEELMAVLRLRTGESLTTASGFTIDRVE